MSHLLFAAWVVAGLVLILPLRRLLRLGRRLVGRDRGVRQGAGSAGAVSPAGETWPSPSGVDTEGVELGLPADSAPESPAVRPSRNLTRRIGAMAGFLLYVAFIAGAIYHVPQILSWTLDTPYPMASVSSQSMWPALKEGDTIFLKGVDKPEDLHVGDIIAFEHTKGITVHRIVEIDGDLITTKGDANPRDDKPIRFDQVVGRVLTIGGRLARVPYVGSIAGLFGQRTAQTDPAPDEQGDPEEEASETSAPSGAGASAEGQIAPERPGAASSGTTERVSVDSAGNQADGFSTSPAISADGRFVALASAATNLVPGDTNGQRDIFVHDRETGATERVSVDSAGSQADGDSEAPAVSADGRYVAFVSAATNLVPGDTNGESDVFVHDCETGATERVSVGSAGNQAHGGSDRPAISGDGRFVAFISAATNLVPGDTNGEGDVFVHDLRTGATERVSVDSADDQANGSSDTPAISADGRFVAFASTATNLVAGDDNGESDVFVRDRRTGATERVSVDGAGGQSDGSSTSPTISADGRFVAYESKARNLVPRDTNRHTDIFIHDRRMGATERVSVNSAGNQANAPTTTPAVSADGRFVAFQAGHSNLVPGDTNRRQDVFVHDRLTGTTEQVSADAAGEQGNDHSSDPDVSGDGRFVSFSSLSSNLVSGDTNLAQDVFIRDRGAVGIR